MRPRSASGPIVARTERTLVNMADGYSRATNGRRIGVAAVQHGPGAENAYAGVAQAFADGSPLLFLPGGQRGGARRHRPRTSTRRRSYRTVTKWSARINACPARPRPAAARVHAAPQRPPGPGAAGAADRRRRRRGRAVRLSARPRRCAHGRRPAAVREAVRALLAAAPAAAARRPGRALGGGVGRAPRIRRAGPGAR